jgi:hypothetical protein
VAERGEKTVLGGVSRFGGLFLLRQFHFDLTAMDEEADLAAECFDQRDQIVIGLDCLGAKQLQHAIDLAFRAERKRECPFEICRGGRGGALEIVVLTQIADPLGRL